MNTFGTAPDSPTAAKSRISNAGWHASLGPWFAFKPWRMAIAMSVTANLERPAAPAFVERRRAPRRVIIAHHIQVSGFSATGEPFAEQTRTLNVSERGCCFEVAQCLVPGDIVSIKVRRAVAGPYNFRVIWAQRKSNHWIVGAMLIEPADVWDMVFPPRTP